MCFPRNPTADHSGVGQCCICGFCVWSQEGYGYVGVDWTRRQVVWHRACEQALDYLQWLEEQHP